MAGGRAGREALFFAAVLPTLIAAAISGDGNTLKPGDRLEDGGYLVSSDRGFRLGFFSSENSTNSYVGIWYEKISVRTVVWVANRDKPLRDKTGILSISDNGSLSISDSTGKVYWQTPPTVPVGPTAILLAGGNFVVSVAGGYAWQSFDHPTDSLLPGMKLGFDRHTGSTRNLTSWKSDHDPAPGNFTFFLDPNGVPQMTLAQGAERLWRSGPWTGKLFSGIPEMTYSYFNHSFVSNSDEVFYQFTILSNDTLSRLVVTKEGLLERLIWVDGKWNPGWIRPRDSCSHFGFCGIFGVCDANVSPMCRCLQGFEPSSLANWNFGDWKNGCRRRTDLECQMGTDGFKKVAGGKLPDASSAVVNKKMTMDECSKACLRNCSCTAYAAAEINDDDGSGCIMWSGALNDIRVYGDGEQDLFVRLAGADLGSSNKSRAVVAAVAATASILLAVLMLGLLVRFARLENNTRHSTVVLGNFPSVELQASNEEISRSREVDLPLFDLADIAAATDNFSPDNMLGVGGFGTVYKGLLEGKQEIAVKRLAKSSFQGLDEFMNEVQVIAKLQHRNLVRLLGSCVDGEERILVYEYMPNGSLDSFIFDKTQASMLDWPMRLRIIGGIARGLLYLHQDSHLRIIHRDLKAGNVLLDHVMNPKISDFGMARIFSGDETEGITRRVVGTIGYMSPEYAIDGSFSVKSDVYSFGVLLLEIISGRRNRVVYHSDHKLNLLGSAWNLWKEGRGLELVDSSLVFPIPVAEVLKCVKIGLLCVQEKPDDRPEMAAIVVMLGSENSALPHPKPPWIAVARERLDGSSSSTVNNVTISAIQAR